MSLEIERKFLVDTPPPQDRLRNATPIRQGYLAEDDGVSVRVRIMPDESVVTIKAGRGLSRTEVEPEISPEEAEELWPFTDGRQLEKTRYEVDVDGHTATVDVFRGALDGLVLAEVEFESEEQAVEFEPPAWFGREVTSDERWSNASLARHGRPD